MPRRNRRIPQPTHKPWRQITGRELDALARFAAEHLSEHGRARASVPAGGDDRHVMSGSECPTTGVRFLSFGDTLDPRALRLAACVKPSDAAGNLAA